MHKAVLLFAAGLMLGATSIANAVDLKDCSKGTTNQRLACQEANTVLLNSSYQTVAAELRQAVADLTQKYKDLKSQVDAMKPPDLSKFVAKDQPIKLGIDNRCLAATSGESGQIPASPPFDVNLLVIFQDCPHAPAWSFH